MKHNLYFLNALLMSAVIFLVAIKPSQKNYFIDAAVPNRIYLEHQLIHNESFSPTTFYLFSPGNAGSLQINGKYLKNNELAEFIKNLIKDKNIHRLNIYGSEFTKGKNGEAALRFLEKKLAVKVSASVDVTGKTGDWELEAGGRQPVLSFPKYNYDL